VAVWSASTETLILTFNQCKKTPNVANVEMNVSGNRQFMVRK